MDMRSLLVGLVTAGLFGWGGGTVGICQERGGGPRREPPRERPEGRPERPEGRPDQDHERKCGKDRAKLLEERHKEGAGDREEGARRIDKHLKDKHPNGRCHCQCKHEKRHPRKDGEPRPPGHPPAPDGEGHKDPPKGDNGVGNGEDPQPPGNPPANDGSGTGRGRPDHKGGGKK